MRCRKLSSLPLSSPPTPSSPQSFVAFVQCKIYEIIIITIDWSNYKAFIRANHSCLEIIAVIRWDKAFLRSFYFMTLNKPSNTNLIIFPTNGKEGAESEREGKNRNVFRHWVGVFVALDIMLKLPCIEEKALVEYRIKYWIGANWANWHDWMHGNFAYAWNVI